jgi:histone acetyltransferase SAS3
LPSQRGAIKPDSHSVFNHLIVDDDPLDGSRLLRKRKTSSAEAEDRPIFPKRRRRNVSEVLKEDADVAQGGSETGLVAGSANDEKAKALPHRPSRSLRLKSSGNLRVYTVQKSLHKLILGMRIDPIELRHILSQPAKPKKSRNRNRSEPVPRRRRRSSAVAAAYMPQSYTQPFYSFHDRENDELKSKPYGGILTGDEANTEKTLPQAEDRRRFDDTRQKAEDDWKLKTAAAAADNEVVRKPRKVSGPASQIECINFGGYEIDTWYAAPYPEEYSRNRVLHVCEFCLKYMSSEYVAWRHKLKCQAKHPPGDEIYRDGQIAVFEVDGRKNPVYCQNLCLLAKLFLGSKTLYYDVEPFLFYVMTVYDKFGCHFVGYFSKEKRPSSQNNVSCILTLPIHQRKGYGNLLIDFSYLLTRVEQKSGSPEKPLSDMGLVSYRNYWRLILCYQLRNQREPLSIVDISERTGMTADDIVSALEGLRALVRDPETGTYALRLDHDFFEEYIQKWEDKKYVKLNEKALVWTPYIMGRSNTAIMEHAPALNALAPRDDEEEDSKKDTALQLALSNGSSEMINGITPTNEARDPSSMEIDKRPLDITDPTPTLSESHLVDQVLKTEPSADEADVSPSNGLHQSTLSETPKTNGHPTSIHDIPPTRFEIYPPLPGTRNHKSLISRSATRQRTGAPSTSRPSARRRTSGRPGATRRRSTGTSSRRRTGGTGRGPGRWPKGTTKKDFGNAGSGPGLPPRLLKARSRLGQELSREGDEGDQEEEEGGEDGNGEGSEEEEEVDEDAILYETPGPSRSRRSMGSRARSYGGKGAQFGTPAGGEEDEYEPVVGDVDAEAEEE